MEKKYLVNIQINVADEDDAIKVGVVTEEKLNELKKCKVNATMFQCGEDEEPIDFEEIAYYREISEEEIKVLSKFSLASMSTGYVYFVDENNDYVDVSF